MLLKSYITHATIMLTKFESVSAPAFNLVQRDAFQPSSEAVEEEPGSRRGGRSPVSPCRDTAQLCHRPQDSFAPNIVLQQGDVKPRLWQLLT